MWGTTATAWTALGTIAGIASLLTTVTIAVIVQRSSSRTDAATRRISRSIEDLVRRGRRDDLLQQLRTERDRANLPLLIDEARMLAKESASEQLAIERAFFGNPASDLLSYEHQLPRGMSERARTAVVNAVIESLPSRFVAGSIPPPRFAADLARLTRLAKDADAKAHEIAQFVVERSISGWDVSDGMIRTILHPESGLACPPNLDAAADYLHAVQYAPTSSASLVNVVAGVSLATWDLRRSGASRALPADLYPAYIMLMQRKLHDVGHVAETAEMSISIDHAIAAMVDALGLLAGADQHLNMRALEALNPILRSFDSQFFTSTGVVAEHLIAGARRLLETNAPVHLRRELSDAIVTLIPTFTASPTPD